eukprot:GDKI01014433.1.p1 GENE.GDKI01014433.1~~GDKI01014433.1.p1  ORF type:complete len:126 (+),score=10.87 GDKI01014433.1:147-524(+)
MLGRVQFAIMHAHINVYTHIHTLNSTVPKWTGQGAVRVYMLTHKFHAPHTYYYTRKNAHTCIYTPPRPQHIRVRMCSDYRVHIQPLHTYTWYTHHTQLTAHGALASMNVCDNLPHIHASVRTHAQ